MPRRPVPKCPNDQHLWAPLRKPHQYGAPVLANIFVSSPAIKECERCHEMKIAHRDLLSAILVACLIQKPRRLTGRELEFFRQLLDFDDLLFGNAIGLDLERWTRVRDKNQPVHAIVDELIRLRVHLAVKHRIPDLEERMRIDLTPLRQGHERGVEANFQLVVEADVNWRNVKFRWRAAADPASRAR